MARAAEEVLTASSETSPARASTAYLRTTSSAIVREVDDLPVHDELAPIHAGEVEKVTDETLEPSPLLPDRRCGFDGAEDPVLEAFCVAANGRKRRLQLVADRQEEVPLDLSGPVQLVGHVVEGLGEERELGRALEWNRLRRDSFGQAAARLRHSADGPRDPASENDGSRARRARHRWHRR